MEYATLKNICRGLMVIGILIIIASIVLGIFVNGDYLFYMMLGAVVFSIGLIGNGIVKQEQEQSIGEKHIRANQGNLEIQGEQVYANVKIQEENQVEGE